MPWCAKVSEPPTLEIDLVLEIRTILAPTEFSHHSDRAVKYACDLAEKFGASLHLLHVLAEVMPVGPDPMLTPVLPPNFYAEMEAASNQTMERLIKPDWGKPASVTHSVAWGDPVTMITEYATTHQVDLMVIATHGRTGFSHVVLGSVAEHIVRHSPVPVLTIHDPDIPRKFAPAKK